MIREKTVFILGAGASKDYGLPVGTELKEKILRTLESGQVINEISSRYGYDLKLIGDFKSAFETSELLSVDSFLEKKNDPEFARLGKHLIAYHIGAEESIPKLSGKWLGELWNLLSQGTRRQEDLLHNKVAFVVFNYDRVLERFFEKALLASYPPSEKNNDILNRFIIIHTYGQIGLLPWQRNEEGLPVLPYDGSQMTWDKARDSSKGIRVMHEGGVNGGGFFKAQECIFAADKVVFMGFGYHAENMGRLALPNPDRPKKVVGSCFGIQYQVPQKWKEKLANGFGYDIDIRHVNSLEAYLKEIADIR